MARRRDSSDIPEEKKHETDETVVEARAKKGAAPKRATPRKTVAREKKAPATHTPQAVERAEAIAAESDNPLTGVTAAPEAIAPAVATPPPPVSPVVYYTSLMTDDDVFLFNEGSHFNLYEKLGAKIIQVEGVWGTHFAVWAPNAYSVYVTGDFNGWNKESHPLGQRDSSGLWEGFIAGLDKGAHYKYYIHSRFHGYKVEKADPFAAYAEIPPRTASIVWDYDFEWHDQEWMARRRNANALDAPISIYEVHLGSWRHNPGEMNQSLSYREMAMALANYVREAGFTHVEFMPVMEHPFYGSWGYQVTGFFAPTSRYGSPHDFAYLVDCLHQAGIGVILDWVPSHFPSDEIGLAYFDGTHLFEHEDPRQGYHPDWGSYIFNYGRSEVRSFLISSGMF